MAIPFLNNINLSDNELQNAKLHVTSTAPTAAAAQIYFDSTPSDLTAKYYSNSTDLWVSLKEYSFPTGNYVTGALTGTTPKPIITFDLNAVDGTSAAGERYLTKTNKWAEISTIPGTYTWSIQADQPAGTTAVASGDAIDFAGGTNVTTVLSGTTLTINSTDQFQGTVTSITAGVGLTGGVITTSGTITLDYNGSDNYIQDNPNGIAIPESDSSINFNSNIDDDVYVTELGAIPVSALTLVKNYIDSSVSGGVYYQGGYDPTTDLTSPGNYGLQTPPNPNIIEIGWMYTVTADGTFFGEQLRVGDVLIAEIDAPTSLSDWTTVQNNIDFATAGTDTGVGAAIVGISRYDEDDFTVSSTGFVQLTVPAARSGSIAVPNSATYTYPSSITASATNSVLIQLVDGSTGETVYADVTRLSTTTFSVNYGVTTPTGVIALIQLIG